MHVSLILTRPVMIKTMAMGLMGFLAMQFEEDATILIETTTTMDTTQQQKGMSFYSAHVPPPAGVDYRENPTVFGGILRGEVPTVVVDETFDLLVFQDRKPHASMHDLIIPKRLIESIFDLQTTDLPILYEMKEEALELLRQQQPQALARKDYRLVFHVPPFNSVDHLHLHVIAPASEMSLFYRVIKYKGDTRTCVNLDMVIKRLEEGRATVPYDRPTQYIIEWKRRGFRLF
jgi:diadenosine tetraphosphate (Ap4A) HIT family hydrolase